MANKGPLRYSVNEDQAVLEIQQGTPALDRSVSLRRQVTAQAMQVFGGWGYREIQLPLLEHFDALKRGLDDDQIARSFRFVDRAGNLMVLRPDVTPAVAKTYAYQLRGLPLPLRVSYAHKVVRIERAFGAAQVENYQLGAELIGREGVVADVEILLVILELLERLGLRGFHINLGDHRLAQLLLSATGAPRRIRQEVREAILARDPDEVRRILEELGTRQQFVDALSVLAGLEGGLQQLDVIEATLNGDQALRERIRYLREVEKTIDELGYGTKVRIDLGEIDGPEYYTGIGFSVVSEGASRWIARGGRYDKLIAQFGPDVPALGFSFSLETLVELLHPKMARGSRRRRSHELVAVHQDDPTTGFQQALERRRNNLSTRIVARDSEER